MDFVLDLFKNQKIKGIYYADIRTPQSGGRDGKPRLPSGGRGDRPRIHTDLSHAEWGDTTGRRDGHQSGAAFARHGKYPALWTDRSDRNKTLGWAGKAAGRRG